MSQSDSIVASLGVAHDGVFAATQYEAGTNRSGLQMFRHCYVSQLAGAGLAWLAQLESAPAIAQTRDSDRGRDWGIER